MALRLLSKVRCEMRGARMQGRLVLVAVCRKSSELRVR